MRYNVGVVGTGYMAAKQCAVLSAREDTRLLTICSTDRSSPIGRSFKDRFGFERNVTSFGELLSDSRIDLIFVCSPDATHPEYVVDALRAGKHVLCEKPLARSEQEFHTVEQALSRSGAILQIGMNCRFRERYSKAKQIVSHGELRKLWFARGTYVYNTVEAVRKGEKAWALEHPPGISPFLHGGAIHTIDLLRWVAGEVHAVFASGAAFELQEEYGLDTWFISLEFENGAMGELTVGASAFRPNDLSLELWFEGGSILDTKVYRRRENSIEPQSDQISFNPMGPDLQLQYENMLQAIGTGFSPLNSFAEAYANFHVITAVEQSVKEKRLVYINNTTNAKGAFDLYGN